MFSFTVGGNPATCVMSIVEKDIYFNDTKANLTWKAFNKPRYLPLFGE